MDNPVSWFVILLLAVCLLYVFFKAVAEHLPEPRKEYPEISSMKKNLDWN